MTYGRYWRLLAALLVPLGVLAGCQRRGQVANTSGARATLVSVTPSPAASGPVTLVIALTGPTGQPVSGASLRLEGDMNMAGMRPVIGTLTDQGNGHYISHGFQLTMGGDWTLTVSGTTKDGKAVEQTISLAGVKGFVVPGRRGFPSRTGAAVAIAAGEADGG